MLAFKIVVGTFSLIVACVGALLFIGNGFVLAHKSSLKPPHGSKEKAETEWKKTHKQQLNRLKKFQLIFGLIAVAGILIPALLLR